MGLGSRSRITSKFGFVFEGVSLPACSWPGFHPARFLYVQDIVDTEEHVGTGHTTWQVLNVVVRVEVVVPLTCVTICQTTRTVLIAVSGTVFQSRSWQEERLFRRVSPCGTAWLLSCTTLTRSTTASPTTMSATSNSAIAVPEYGRRTMDGEHYHKDDSAWRRRSRGSFRPGKVRIPG